MTEMETVHADLWAMGISVGKHPTEFVREELARQGVVTAVDLRELPDRTVVEVAGVVTHRQQPATAKGTVFLNLEDETGLVNVICTKGVWKRFRTVARGAPALRVRGVLEKHQGVINLVAGPHHPPADQPGGHTALTRLPLVQSATEVSAAGSVAGALMGAFRLASTVARPATTRLATRGRITATRACQLPELRTVTPEPNGGLSTVTVARFHIE